MSMPQSRRNDWRAVLKTIKVMKTQRGNKMNQVISVSLDDGKTWVSASGKVRIFIPNRGENVAATQTGGVEIDIATEEVRAVAVDATGNQSVVRVIDLSELAAG